MPTQDNSETRACLLRALEVLDRARNAAARTNLPPTMAPGDIRTQIDGIGRLLAEAGDSLDAARAAAVRASRRGLTVSR